MMKEGIRRRIAKACYLRLLAIWSVTRTVDLIRIFANDDCNPDVSIERVAEALALIRRADPQRHSRIVRDVPVIHVGPMKTSRARWSTMGVCHLGAQFVTDDNTTPPEVAAVIVHEATHARLARCGVGYAEDERMRVEHVCFRQELAFLARVDMPEAATAAADTAWQLERDASYWSDGSIRARDMEELRSIGLPGWLADLLASVVSRRAA